VTGRPTSWPRTSGTGCGWPASASAGSTGASAAGAAHLPAEPPKYDAEDLLSLTRTTTRARSRRILTAANFDEFKPAHGPALVAGWGELHGYPSACWPAPAGRTRRAEAQKGRPLIQLANATDTALLSPGDARFGRPRSRR
jgi:hypothetical protein